MTCDTAFSKVNRATAAVVLGIIMTGSMAPAATTYWDANGAATGLGGTGQWQDGAGNWSTDTDGTATTTWDNGALSAADFRGDAGTVTTAGSVVASQLLFNSGGYVLSGSDVTLDPASDSNPTIINYAAGTGTNTISSNLVISDDVAAGNVFTIRNSVAGTLALGGNVTLTTTNTTPSGAKTYAIYNDNAAGITILNGSFGAGPGNSTTNFTFNGPGTTYLNAANSLDGNSLMNGGTVILGDNSAISPGRSLTMGNSSTSTSMALLTAGARTIANNVEMKGNGSSSHEIGGSTADVSTYSGQMKFSSSGSTIKLTAVAGGRVNFSGQLIIGKALEKQGDGIVAFSANNNSGGGGVTVSAGTLLVMNTAGSGTATSAISLGGSGAFGGTGISTGLITTAAASGVLTPGDMALNGISAIGTLRASGGLDATAGVTFNYDINGSAVDQINFASGPLTLGGTATFNFLNLGSIDLETPYTLFTGSGTWTGAPLFAFNVPDGYRLDPSYGSGGYLWNPAENAMSVQFATVPEPTALALLGLGGLSMMRRRRFTGSASRA